LGLGWIRKGKEGLGWGGGRRRRRFGGEVF